VTRPPHPKQGALAEGFRQAVDLMPHIVRIATGDHLIESVNTQDRLRRVAGEDLFGWKWLSIAQSEDAIACNSLARQLPEQGLR